MKKLLRALLLVILAGFVLWGTPIQDHLEKNAEGFSEAEAKEKELLQEALDEYAQKEALEAEAAQIEALREDTEYANNHYSIRLMMVGDNLMHMGIVASGKQPDGSLNYDFLYDGIADFLQYSDIKIINQETILGGNNLGFSGFPKFNSPTEVADAIANAGFNVVLHASNHAADKDLQGLLSCVGLWRDKHPEILMLGISENIPENDSTYNYFKAEPKEYDADTAAFKKLCSQFDITPNYVKGEYEKENCEDFGIITLGGIRFAILNYTYGPNLETIPSQINGHLNILCKYNENSLAINFKELNPNVTEQIKKARECADVVIVCPHWGTEYVTEPSKYQREFAYEMTQAGADIIIGTHPHVVQPVEWIEADNGNEAICFYSLGNYISTQKDPLSMLEGLAWIEFDVSGGKAEINREKTGVVPLVCQYEAMPVRAVGVYPLEDYSEELAKSHGIKNYGGVPLIYNDLLTWNEEIFGDYELTREEITQ